MLQEVYSGNAIRYAHQGLKIFKFNYSYLLKITRFKKFKLEKVRSEKTFASSSDERKDPEIINILTDRNRSVLSSV